MTKQISDLEALLKQWGNAYATKAGTTIKWIELHGDHPDLTERQKYKLKTRVTNVRYQGNPSSNEMPGYIVKDTAINDTSSSQKSVFRQKKETTSSFTWTLHKTIRTGKDVTFTVPIPPMALSTIKSTEISTESTLSKTETKTEKWSIERQVTVTPQNKMDMTWTVKEKETTDTFYADVMLTGYIAFCCEDNVDINDPDGDDAHALWFTPIVEVFDQMIEWGIEVPASDYVVAFNAVIFRISGECKGVFAYDTSFVMKDPNKAAIESSFINAFSSN